MFLDVPDDGMASPPRVLVAEDQPLLGWAIGRVLAPLNAEVVLARTYRETTDQLSAGEFPVVILSASLEGRSTLGLAKELTILRPATRLVVLCDGDCDRLYTDLPRATIFRKPFVLTDLVAVVAPDFEAHAHA
jgi:DNA-binding NtrC family response regulator